MVVVEVPLEIAPPLVAIALLFSNLESSTIKVPDATIIAPPLPEIPVLLMKSQFSTII